MLGRVVNQAREDGTDSSSSKHTDSPPPPRNGKNLPKDSLSSRTEKRAASAGGLGWELPSVTVLWERLPALCRPQLSLPCIQGAWSL